MTVSVWQEQVEPVSEVSHDVAIIGCGLVGSYAASLLTAAGKDVAIIEARFGASGRNAGFVHLGVRHLYSEAVEIFGHDVARDVWNLTVDNVRRMRRFAKDFGVEHEEKGAAFVSTDEAKSAEMRKSVKLARGDGFQVEYLDRDPFERGFKAAIVHPNDFAIHPARLTNTMVRSSGATLYQNRRDGRHHSRWRGAGCENTSKVGALWPGTIGGQRLRGSGPSLLPPTRRAGQGGGTSYRATA